LLKAAGDFAHKVSPSLSYHIICRRLLSLSSQVCMQKTRRLVLLKR